MSHGSRVFTRIDPAAVLDLGELGVDDALVARLCRASAPGLAILEDLEQRFAQRVCAGSNRDALLNEEGSDPADRRSPA